MTPHLQFAEVSCPFKTREEYGRHPVLCTVQARQEKPLIWVNYSDLSRGHPKWWFSKGIPLQIPLNQVKDL